MCLFAPKQNDDFSPKDRCANGRLSKTACLYDASRVQKLFSCNSFAHLTPETNFITAGEEESSIQPIVQVRGTTNPQGTCGYLSFWSWTWCSTKMTSPSLDHFISSCAHREGFRFASTVLLPLDSGLSRAAKSIPAMAYDQGILSSAQQAFPPGHVWSKSCQRLMVTLNGIVLCWCDAYRANWCYLWGTRGLGVTDMYVHLANESVNLRSIHLWRSKHKYPGKSTTNSKIFKHLAFQVSSLKAKKKNPKVLFTNHKGTMGYSLGWSCSSRDDRQKPRHQDSPCDIELRQVFLSCWKTESEFAANYPLAFTISANLGLSPAFLDAPGHSGNPNEPAYSDHGHDCFAAFLVSFTCHNNFPTRNDNNAHRLQSSFFPPHVKLQT